ncbi:DUF928 domain-containing protein [Pantanalinema rosaneae CENA516]|uniref:DUF928 domain-containing protein n=1 Tax=Pantanalinema rosaneae TaxID=1620701 RepID=UPI003D6E91F1
MAEKFVLNPLPLAALSALLSVTVGVASPLLFSQSVFAQLPPVPSGGGRPGGTIAGGSRFAPPPPPSDMGAPGSRSSGASRGICLGSQDIIALMPIYPQGRSQLVWGLTTVDHPTFWFYVPSVTGPAAEMEFVLRDQSGQKLYETKADLTQAGVMGVTLPTTAPTLTTGDRYQWYFKVRCPAAPSQLPKYVNGWIERRAIAPTLASQLQQATPAQRAALYAQQGIWFDAVTTLAQLRQSQPNDATLAQQWAELLESVQLPELATQPLLK